MRGTRICMIWAAQKAVFASNASTFLLNAAPVSVTLLRFTLFQKLLHQQPNVTLYRLYNVWLCACLFLNNPHRSPEIPQDELLHTASLGHQDLMGAAALSRWWTVRATSLTPEFGEDGEFQQHHTTSRSPNRKKLHPLGRHITNTYKHLLVHRTLYILYIYTYYIYIYIYYTYIHIHTKYRHIPINRVLNMDSTGSVWHPQALSCPVDISEGRNAICQDMPRPSVAHFIHKILRNCSTLQTATIESYWIILNRCIWKSMQLGVIDVHILHIHIGMIVDVYLDK